MARKEKTMRYKAPALAMMILCAGILFAYSYNWSGSAASEKNTQALHIELPPQVNFPPEGKSACSLFEEVPGTVRVVKAPPGSAPQWVREAWVGVRLSPAMPILGATGSVLGYQIDMKTALGALEAHGRYNAAAWWRSSAGPLQTHPFRLLC